MAVWVMTKLEAAKVALALGLVQAVGLALAECRKQRGFLQ